MNPVKRLELQRVGGHDSTLLWRESMLEVLGMNTEEQETDYKHGLSKEEQETVVFETLGTEESYRLETSETPKGTVATEGKKADKRIKTVEKGKKIQVIDISTLESLWAKGNNSEGNKKRKKDESPEGDKKLNKES